MKQITAFTETHVTTPGYVAITADGDMTSITVRSRGRDGYTGNGASVELSVDDLLQLADDVIATYRPEPVKSAKK